MPSEATLKGVMAYWPSTTMKKREKDAITQIGYYFNDEDEHDESGLDTVWAENKLLDKKKNPDEADYIYERVPSHYRPYLNIIFHRLDLLSYCADTAGPPDIILYNLEYLNAVLDGFWSEVAVKRSSRGGMDAEWRSEIMDTWLCIEGRVLMHEPKAVRKFINDASMEDLISDAFTIGMLLSVTLFCYIVI